MEDKYLVRMMKTEVYNFKNITYGVIPYMNYGSLNSKAKINYTDIVGIYGQNGSGKTAFVEVLDILKYIIRGESIPYVYAGMLPADDSETEIANTFFVEKDGDKYKAEYRAKIRANQTKKKIEIYHEALTYWKRSSSWIKERHMEFDNPFYDNENILLHKQVAMQTSHFPQSEFKKIFFFNEMQNLALVSAESNISLFFNNLVRDGLNKLDETPDIVALRSIITGVFQFGWVNYNVIKVNQLGTINENQSIPFNVHNETETEIMQGCWNLGINAPAEILMDDFDRYSNKIEAINIAIKSIIPNLQIELVKKQEMDRPDGQKCVQVELYSKRGDKMFQMRYESEGIKRIISILDYLISVFNDSSVCLVVDELDSGIFEYLLGELLGLMNEEMKGQLIFTSHNLRILEKLNSKNIVCSTVNPNNRFIRLTGVESNNNKRDFYIRAITVGGQKEELYDEDDLVAMGYSFRKAGKHERTFPMMQS